MGARGLTALETKFLILSFPSFWGPNIETASRGFRFRISFSFVVEKGIALGDVIHTKAIALIG